jgi:hypothetical protein
MKERVSAGRFRQVLEARKRCTPCLAGCTTPYSLLFRGSAKDLVKEALNYYKSYRNTVENWLRSCSRSSAASPDLGAYRKRFQNELP